MAALRRQQLTYETLPDLDPRVREAFNRELMGLAQDLDDRPAVKGVRTLTLKVALVPVPDDAGHLAKVRMAAQVSSTMPKRQTQAHELDYHQGGRISFTPAVEDEVEA